VPDVYLTITDNWISFHVRYITEVRSRRILRSKLSRHILEEIEKSGQGKVKIASGTLDIAISSMPKTEPNRSGKKDNE
jgi:small-conductance mechanosensitive channel